MSHAKNGYSAVPHAFIRSSLIMRSDDANSRLLVL